MAVKIRLRRTGTRNKPCHRIVVANARSPRDGRFIENIGVYDPCKKSETIDLERADYWLSVGAQASETVKAIIERARKGTPLAPSKKVEPVVEETPKAEEPKAEAEEEATAEAVEEETAAAEE